MLKKRVNSSAHGSLARFLLPRGGWKK